MYENALKILEHYGKARELCDWAFQDSVNLVSSNSVTFKTVWYWYEDIPIDE